MSMARHHPGSPLAAAALFLCLLSACRATTVLLPVSKDDATQQYVASFLQRTPLVPVKAVLDLAGAMLRVDCEPGHYASSTYSPVPCGSSQCRTDVLALPTTSSPSPPGPLATANKFRFACGDTSLTQGLAAGAAGTASLSRARFALPTQLASTFHFSRKFALCLPSSAGAGVVVFGDAPYTFQPGFVLSDTSLMYTPLLVNPASRDEYFVGVTGINVNGQAVPLDAKLLAIDRKSGVGGTKLSTVAPYTVLQSSIYKAVTGAFAATTSQSARVPPVAPFHLCYDGSKLLSTRVGPAVPTIELVLGKATSWMVFGANSMVATKGGALCLGVVDGGKAPQTSVVIGGHMMEDNLLQFDLEKSRLGFSSSLLFRQTNCNNFHLG